MAVSMVYRRVDKKAGRKRPGWTFMGRTETGWRQLGAHTSNKQLAHKVEGMWETLASEYRAWDILGRVMAGQLTILQLHDLWVQSKYSIHDLRRLLNDVDLEPVVEEWHAIHGRSGIKAYSAAHALVHIRTLIPEGVVRLASSVTTDWLTSELYAYPGRPNTLRKVHSSWTGFLGYCTIVKGLFAANPMEKVARPTLERSPIRFYELDTVERIVGAQPSPERRALFAVLYGTGIEVSTALALTRADMWEASREVRAAGTKAHSRDRVCRVADWAWEMVWEHCRRVFPTARIWPQGWSRWTVSDWHRKTVEALKLPARHPLHCARDHWAVRAASAGTPVAIIQSQLGHGSPMLTLTKYGRFLPTAADRATWEAAATTYEVARRSMTSGS